MRKTQVISLVLSNNEQRKQFIEEIIREGAERKRQKLNEQLEKGFNSKINGVKTFIDTKAIKEKLAETIGFDDKVFNSDFEKSELKRLYRDLVKIGLIE